MLPLLRILLLWVTLLFSFHSVLAHFWLGRVAATTLEAGIETNALRFYGFLLAFGIAGYYFCREIEEWKKPMPVKVVASAILAILFLVGFFRLAEMDNREYKETSSYQTQLVSGRLHASPTEVGSFFGNAVAKGATREDVEAAYPDCLPHELQIRRDGTAYENFFYWMGPGSLPIGAQVSYSTPPYTVTSVEALPRSLTALPQSGAGSAEQRPADEDEGKPEEGTDGPP